MMESLEKCGHGKNLLQLPREDCPECEEVWEAMCARRDLIALLRKIDGVLALQAENKRLLNEVDSLKAENERLFAKCLYAWRKIKRLQKTQLSDYC